MWSNLFEILTSDTMHCNALGHDGFYFILKKHLKLSQKIDFLAHLRGLWFTTSYALSVTPQPSAKLNPLWRYIIMISFIIGAFAIVRL